MSTEVAYTTECIQEFLDFLTGTAVPDGMEVKHGPKLKHEVAFTVIWFLQEHLGCLPSNFEMCRHCKRIFNKDAEGYSLDDQYSVNGRTLPKKYWGAWCDCCVPDIEFKLD